MKKALILIFIVYNFGNTISYSQETIGLLNYDLDNVQDGYTLFSPLSNSSVYLIDNCGNVVNEWTFNGAPRSIAYLLEDGTLLRSGSEGLEIRAWDNSLLWSYDILTELGLRQHHDIEPLPNGNILAIIREFITEEEQINLGKNPALIDGNLKSEKIIEFQPIGTNEIQIVWEWRFADHLIQDFDATKENYGVVENHPELIDFNYEDSNMVHSDWIHMNGMDYNADLDQIIMSPKSLGELYIIDHSTTTAEAATHLGGNYNKGGDFLWRWGNPEVYRQGTSADRKLFEQHDPKWIPNAYLNGGSVSVFNNEAGGTENYSSINIITPVPLSASYEMANNTFNPIDFLWSWNGEVLGETVYQSKQSGVIAMPNGNMVFCETLKGRLTEIDSNGNIVWIYRNPSGTVIFDQFSIESETSSNTLFKAEKYPSDFIGFIGKDLTPGSIIENTNSNSAGCNLILSVEDITVTNEIEILNNPVYDSSVIFSRNLPSSTLIRVYNISGQIIIKNKTAENKTLYLPYISKGLYFMELEDQSDGKIQVIKFIKM